VREGVGLADVVLLPDRVLDGVGGGVPVPDPVVVEEGVPLPVGLAVTLPLKLALPVLEADAPDVSEGVRDALVVLLALSVQEGVLKAVPVPDPVAVDVGVPLGD
jgi:hypothetical protein